MQSLSLLLQRKKMETRSSLNWKKNPGTFNPLNLGLIDFEDDFPVISNSYIPESFKVALCHDYRSLNPNSFVNCFTDDYVLGRFWNNPEKYIERFSECGLVMTPDYSLLVGMPKPLQMFNVYKNRLIGYFWKKNGVNIIPTVGWSDKKSFEYCFLGIEEGSNVCVSNIGCRNLENKKFFDEGLTAMKETIKPKKIIFQCNEKYKEFYQNDDIIFIDSFWETKRKSIY